MHKLCIHEYRKLLYRTFVLTTYRKHKANGEEKIAAELKRLSKIEKSSKSMAPAQSAWLKDRLNVIKMLEKGEAAAKDDL